MAAAATIADVQRIVAEASAAFASQATSIGEQGAAIQATKTAIDDIHNKVQLMLTTFDASVENPTTDSGLAHQGPTQLAQCPHAIPQSSQFVFCTF